MSTEPLGLFALASDGVAYSGNKTSEPDSFIFDAATVWGEHAGRLNSPLFMSGTPLPIPGQACLNTG